MEIMPPVLADRCIVMCSQTAHLNQNAAEDALRDVLDQILKDQRLY